MSMKEAEYIEPCESAEELITYKNGGGQYYNLMKRVLKRYLFYEMAIKFRQKVGMLVGDPEDLEFMLLTKMDKNLKLMKASGVPSLEKQEKVLRAAYCSAEMSNLKESGKAEELGMSQSTYSRLKRTGTSNLARLIFIDNDISKLK